MDVESSTSEILSNKNQAIVRGEYLAYSKYEVNDAETELS